MKFLEFPLVELTSGGAHEYGSKTVSVGHIVSVEPGTQNTSFIALSDGNKFSTSITYARVKEMLKCDQNA